MQIPEWLLTLLAHDQHRIELAACSMGPYWQWGAQILDSSRRPIYARCVGVGDSPEEAVEALAELVLLWHRDHPGETGGVLTERLVKLTAQHQALLTANMSRGDLPGRIESLAVVAAQLEPEPESEVANG